MTFRANSEVQDDGEGLRASDPAPHHLEKTVYSLRGEGFVSFSARRTGLTVTLPASVTVFRGGYDVSIPAIWRSLQMLSFFAYAGLVGRNSECSIRFTRRCRHMTSDSHGYSGGNPARAPCVCEVIHTLLQSTWKAKGSLVMLTALFLLGIRI